MKNISVEQVIFIHDELIKRYGGAYDLRDPGLLESAVHRMNATFDGKDLYPSHFEKAAAFLQSLCLNHPFMDGNKRTALNVTLVYLKLNNYALSFDDAEMETFMLNLACGRVDFKQIVKFLKKITK